MIMSKANVALQYKHGSFMKSSIILHLGSLLHIPMNLSDTKVLYNNNCCFSSGVVLLRHLSH